MTNDYWSHISSIHTTYVIVVVVDFLSIISFGTELHLIAHCMCRVRLICFEILGKHILSYLLIWTVGHNHSTIWNFVFLFFCCCCFRPFISYDGTRSIFCMCIMFTYWKIGKFWASRLLDNPRSVQWTVDFFLYVFFFFSSHFCFQYLRSFSISISALHSSNYQSSIHSEKSIVHNIFYTAIEVAIAAAATVERLAVVCFCLF